MYVKIVHMSKRKSIHTVPHNKGWAVKKGGGKRAVKVTETKAEAEKIARDLARREGAELVIHGRDGKIQDADSFGGDPLPPRDKKH